MYNYDDNDNIAITNQAVNSGLPSYQQYQPPVAAPEIPSTTNA